VSLEVEGVAWVSLTWCGGKSETGFYPKQRIMPGTACESLRVFCESMAYSRLKAQWAGCPIPRGLNHFKKLFSIHTVF
jgi:hypothetical protein